MKNFKYKFTLIYLPFLGVAVATIFGYTLLNWLLLIKLQLFSLNEEVVNIWIPLLLPWLPLYIWTRPRLKLLNLKGGNGNLPFLYLLVASFAIAIPTVIAQLWMETASGKLTKLDNISAITSQPPTKYYTLNQVYLDTPRLSTKARIVISGKTNQNYDMNLYIVVPVLATPADTATRTCQAWYGVVYRHTISNRLSAEEKEKRYNDFITESKADFYTKDLNQFVYLDRVGNNDDRKGYLGAIKRARHMLARSNTVLLPVNEPFEARNGHKLLWIFGSLVIGAVVWLSMILIAGIAPAAPARNAAVRKPGQAAARKAAAAKRSAASANPTGGMGFASSKNALDDNGLAALLLPRQGYTVTPIILGLNILIFIIMVFAGLGFISFAASDLLSWGADYRPFVAEGQYWRLVTSIFLHGGIMHLLGNAYGLVLVGIFLEPVLGTTKYALVYLGTGIFASITSLWWHHATVSVGASGAIFGLYGTFLALILTKTYSGRFGRAFLPMALIFVGYNLLLGIKGNVDNAAHIGGLLSGFVVGLLLSTNLKTSVAANS